MTEKQRDYIKSLIADEREFGMFDRADGVEKMLGKNWEKNYKAISNAAVNKAIKELQESMTQSEWAWAIEHGYE